jgi:hypothetical protein
MTVSYQLVKALFSRYVEGPITWPTPLVLQGADVAVTLRESLAVTEVALMVPVRVPGGIGQKVVGLKLTEPSLTTASVVVFVNDETSID